MNGHAADDHKDENYYDFDCCDDSDVDEDDG